MCQVQCNLTDARSKWPRYLQLKQEKFGVAAAWMVDAHLWIHLSSIEPIAPKFYGQQPAPYREDRSRKCRQSLNGSILGNVLVPGVKLSIAQTRFIASCCDSRCLSLSSTAAFNAFISTNHCAHPGRALHCSGGDTAHVITLQLAFTRTDLM